MCGQDRYQKLNWVQIVWKYPNIYYANTTLVMEKRGQICHIGSNNKFLYPLKYTENGFEKRNPHQKDKK